MAFTIPSNLGIGSGLPLSDTLTKLEAVERQPLTLLRSQQAQYQSRQDAYKTLRTSVEAFQTAARALERADAFQGTKTAVTGTAFTASSTAQAIPGNYSISVTSLARAHSLYTTDQSITDRKAELGSGGTVTFSFNGKDSQTLELSGTVTLESLAQAINAESDLGVSATLLNDGGSVRLMLTARETGEQSAITSIGVAGNEALGNLIGYSASDTSRLATGSAAKNAELTINGLQVVSQRNTVADAIDGLTLTLTQTTEAAETLSVTKDTAASSKAVQDFVTAYNNLQSLIARATDFNVAAQTQAPLAGDSSARSLANRIRQVLQVPVANAEVGNLADLGVTTDPKTGLLNVDTKKLDAALAENGDDVAALFQGENGLLARAKATTDQLLSADGMFRSLDTSIGDTIRRLEKQHEAASQRLDAHMEVLLARFAALDSLVAQRSGTSNYLTQQMSLLSSSSNRSSS